MGSLDTVRRGLAWPFWNRRERRLRAGWRITTMLALYLAITIATMVTIESLLPGLGEYAAPFGIALTGLLTAWLAVRFLDGRRLRSLGLRVDRRWWRELLVGVGFGLFTTGGVLAIYLAMGWGTIDGWFVAEDGLFVVAFGLSVATYAAVALLEELLFRGYFVTNATEGVPSGLVRPLGRLVPRRWLAGVPVVIAVAVSSLVFAEFHGDSLTAMDYLHFWLAGVLLAIPYVLTGRLWLSIGLHWAFNVGLTSLFNVEGGVPALIRLEIDGPSLWVGEAALTETAMIAVTILLVLVWARWRGFTHLDDAFRRDSDPVESHAVADD